MEECLEHRSRDLAPALVIGYLEHAAGSFPHYPRELLVQLSVWSKGLQRGDNLRRRLLQPVDFEAVG